MRKAFIALYLLVSLGYLANDAPAQTSRNAEESILVGERRCGWSSASWFQHPPPKDLLGAVKYSLRALRGKGGHLLVHYNCPPDVVQLSLSRGIIYRSCSATEPDCEKTDQIDVSAAMSDIENDVVIHVFEVSGGVIIGQGSKVIWDLSDVVPGQYTIRAWADDGCGNCGKNISQTISVVN